MLRQELNDAWRQAVGEFNLLASQESSALNRINLRTAVKRLEQLLKEVPDEFACICQEPTEEEMERARREVPCLWPDFLKLMEDS